MAITSGTRFPTAKAAHSHYRADGNWRLFQTLYSYNRGQFDEGIEPNLTAMLFNIGATFQTTQSLRDFANVSVRLCHFASDTDFSQLLFAKSDGIYEVKHQRIPIAGIELQAPLCQVNGSDRFNLRYARTNSRFDFDDNGHVNSDLSSANTTADRVNFRWEPGWTDRVDARLRFNNLVDRSTRAFRVSNQFEF